MTPQERAEQVAHTYYSLGPTNLIDLIAESLQDTRRAALLEAVEFLKLMPMLTKDNAIAVLTRLAQEG